MAATAHSFEGVVNKQLTYSNWYHPLLLYIMMRFKVASEGPLGLNVGLHLQIQNFSVHISEELDNCVNNKFVLAELALVPLLATYLNQFWWIGFV